MIGSWEKFKVELNNRTDFAQLFPFTKFFNDAPQRSNLRRKPGNRLRKIPLHLSNIHGTRGTPCIRAFPQWFRPLQISSRKRSENHRDDMYSRHIETKRTREHEFQI